MPVQGTSTAYTGPGFERMSFLAFANITELLVRTISAFAKAKSTFKKRLVCKKIPATRFQL